MWERWDAILPDGSIHSGAMDALPTEDASEDDTGMLSFNHYAYGAMIDWVYRTVGGLAPDTDEPGYRTVHVAPRPAEGLDHASASIETRLGRLAIDWRVPVTDTSTVTIDGAPASGDLSYGRHRITVTAPAVARPSAVVAA